ncbi:MAG: IS5 family transposase [Bacteroidetes bacterium]|nr:IS5 family transposase [Bacteroidota bacterium]
MLAKQKNISQMGFYSTFEEQLSHKHPLYQLAGAINWGVFEKEFSKHYSPTQGKPAKPIRLMVALLILKQVRNLSDESVVDQWAENSYYQYFSGEFYFSPNPPCVATELVEFRKRIGSQGVELIFKESIKVNGDDANDDNLSGDTTIQEKNITYPTDDKLYKKIIKECQSIAKDEQIELRQSYTQTVKKLSTIQRFKKNKNGWSKAKKAGKKVKTIAGVLVRELNRKLPADILNKYSADLNLYEKVLAQKRGDSNKIYSLHEPDVKCYSKGKEHKRFEFGSKVSILITQKTGVIVGALNFNSTAHDSKTLAHALEQYNRLTNKQAKNIFVDRGYQGPKTINETKIFTPKPDNNITKTKRKKHSRRAAIEPVIGHLKSDYRMNRNFLKGVIGDEINVLLSAAAMNFKRVMNLWKQRLINFLFYIIQLVFEPLLYKQCVKTTF